MIGCDARVRYILRLEEYSSRNYMAILENTIAFFVNGGDPIVYDPDCENGTGWDLVTHRRDGMDLRFCEPICDEMRQMTVWDMSTSFECWRVEALS